MKNIIYILTLSIALLVAGCQQEKKESITEPSKTTMGSKYLFSGNYTKEEGHVDGKARGIEVYKMVDPDSLELVFTSSDDINPSYLVLSNDGSRLYAVNETGPDVDSVATINAYAVNDGNGSMRLLNTQSSHGFSPCYISVDSKSRLVFAVNYLSGAIAVYPISNDGSLMEASQVITLTGNGLNKERQEASHPHSIVLSPDEQFAYVADLGTDKVMIYKIDFDQKKLVPAKTTFVQLEPGSGPRHTVFHPSKNFFYVIGELNNKVFVFRHTREDGSLAALQTISTLPDDFEGTSWCADIHISVDGKFLFGSNRGHNSLVVFTIGQDGLLTRIGFESTRGEFPRNFLIDGSDIYVANQNSDNIVKFEIRPDGKLSFRKEFDAKTPVCLKIFDY